MAEFGSIASWGTAFLAGVLSVFSPCVLPLMPAYLSLISGVTVEELQEGDGDGALRRRVMWACAGFVAGFSTIFIVLGASAVVVGHWLRTWRASVLGLEFGVAQIAGFILLLMGLHLLGLLPIHWLYRESRFQLRMERTNFVRTFLAGIAFGFGWSPCIGPILTAILSIAASRETVVQGVGLLAVYSAGLGVPFFLAGWSIEYFFRAFERVKTRFRWIERISGALLVAVAILIMSENLSRLNRYFGFINEILFKIEEALL